MKAIIFGFIVLLFSCSDKKSSKSVGQRDKDSLETGFWQYYSNNHKLLEEGEFQNGLRKGTWKYFVPIADTINWRAYHNERNTIVTNLPNFLQAKEESDSIVVFKHIDTLQLFTLAIGVNYNRESNSFENYKEAMFQDLKSRNIQITDSTSYILQSDNRMIKAERFSFLSYQIFL
jgi:antitoxin component YwqK of YwqJK toxin-antitoxin module